MYLAFRFLREGATLIVSIASPPLITGSMCFALKVGAIGSIEAKIEWCGQND